MKIDQNFGDAIISKAIHSGADQAEAYIKASRGFSVEIKDRSVHSLKSSREFGYALRIIRRNRIGFSFSRSADDLDFVVQSAIDSAEYPEQDISHDLPERLDAADVEVYDACMENIGEDDAVKMVMLLEEAAYNTDRRIRAVRNANGSFYVSETMIANSKSVRTVYKTTSCSAQIMAVAEENAESQVGWDFEGNRFLRGISFDDLGRNAASNAVRLLGSRKMSGCRLPVVLDSSVTADFLGIFASSLSADAVQKGKSLLGGKLGQKVISAKVTMIDNGLLPGRLGSTPADAEAVPVQEKIMLEDGVLQKYLHNTYTANKDNTSSTGNAVRGSFSSLPSVGITNFYLEAASPGEAVSKQMLFNSFHKGLYITDAMGVHTANPVSGEFSIGIAGLLIEDGQIAYPVKEAVISGNILDFFCKIEAVGDDLKFYGNIGGPSLLISDVDISA